ncbi:hypothetical protein [Alkalihalobacillus sp. LMS39]|uniref:hypothetical protein n=1 Tax=Alkalihalobacillus sp. LMS39 TaxID=2924032 RepID=UPI001FB4A689|nr:hypothetical protein [Alkalihalobacillus sp. LMS39]UOE95213.1 hypothetical protein MM271_06215 [Alkalihalobacillus sp. LMS39]
MDRRVHLTGFTNIETFSIDVQVNYSIANWIGRIQASPEVGGTLSDEEIRRFNSKLDIFLKGKVKQENIEISYRVFGIIGCKKLGECRLTRLSLHSSSFFTPIPHLSTYYLFYILTY